MLLNWMGTALNSETKDIKYPVDIAVALGGGIDRQQAAINAVAAKQARAIWVTGPELDLELIAQEGDCFLYRPTPPGSTWTDAHDTLQRALSMGSLRLLVFTSDYHIRRAQLIFNIVAQNTFHATFDIQWKAVPNSLFKLNEWRNSEEGKKIVTGEWLGIISAITKRRPNERI